MNDDVAICLDNITIRFNLGNQKVDNLKEYVIKLVKGELMFQEFLALRDISLTVKKGESWALIGSNGSGKSTLLKAVSGIMKPYKGTIRVNGSISPLIELGAGFDGDLTARENIYINGCLMGHSEEFMREHFQEIVDFSELQDFLDSPLKNFSSGMSARLGFAIATVVKPDILICDEVLAVGDAAFQKKCIARMQEMLNSGVALLFVSHDIDTVKEVCDHAMWLDKGICRMQGECIPVCEAYMKSTEME